MLWLLLLLLLLLTHRCAHLVRVSQVLLPSLSRLSRLFRLFRLFVATRPALRRCPPTSLWSRRSGTLMLCSSRNRTRHATRMTRSSSRTQQRPCPCRRTTWRYGSRGRRVRRSSRSISGFVVKMASCLCWSVCKMSFCRHRL